MTEILTVNKKRDEKFLRRKTEDFDFGKFSRQEIGELVLNMKKAMKEASGVGLSANQIGLAYKVFVARVSNKDGAYKDYAVFNAKIYKSEGKKLLEEGCLSVPGILGMVERAERVGLKGFDKNGRAIKIKAWGLLAQVFQHETDHLEGKLFTDKAKETHKVEDVVKAAQEVRRKSISN